MCVRGDFILQKQTIIPMLLLQEQDIGDTTPYIRVIANSHLHFFKDHYIF